MALIKAAFPILERDTAVQAVIMPSVLTQTPKKAVFAFLGETVESYAKRTAAKVIGEIETISKWHHVYVISYQGQELLLCEAPLGAAAATSVLEELIAGGVTKIIATGTCGALVDTAENQFIIPTKALRDEGISYHYLAAARTVETDNSINQTMRQVLAQKGYGVEFVKTWTTDAFYRETAEMVAYRREEGCTVVEMECAALAACAKFRGVQFGELLFTADTLADVDTYDARTFGRNHFDIALETALECCAAL